jgi:hypothetical protein
VPGARKNEWSDSVGERNLATMDEVGPDDLIVCPVKKKGWNVDSAIEDWELLRCSTVTKLIDRPTSAQTRFVGPRFGHEVDVGIGERPRRCPKAWSVHCRDPCTPQCRCAQFSGKYIGFATLSTSVVARRTISDCFDRTNINTRCNVCVDDHRRNGVKETQPVDEALEPLHHVNSDNAANVSANNSDVLMTEYVVGEFVEIAAVGNEVVGIAV